MHPDLSLQLHRQREQDLLRSMRHPRLDRRGSAQHLRPQTAAWAAALLRRSAVAMDSRRAPLECCPTA